MAFRSSPLSFILPAFLFVNQALAGPFDKRQDATITDTPLSTPATVIETPTPTLEPVLPPTNDPKDFDILKADPKVNLFYAGVTSSQSTSKRSEDEKFVLANLDLSLQHPSVPLDHSQFVADIVCSGGDKLVASFTTQDSYDFCKENWSDLEKIILITATTGCGVDTQNDVFVASSISFSDADLTVTATGAEVDFRKVLSTLDMKWGGASHQVAQRRSINRRDWWDDFTDWFDDLTTFGPYTADATLPIDITPAMGDDESIDEDAPWDNAVLLAEFGGDEEEDNAEKRSLTTRTEGDDSDDGLDVGMKLYCVDCGITGEVTFEGSLAFSLSDGVTECTVGINGNLYAGLYLGLEMHATYTKTWEKDLLKMYMNPWTIPSVVEFGPYVRLGVSAEVEISAVGTLLIGTSATWSAFESTLDLLDSDGSTSSGWDPTIDRKAEATGEIGVSASLGMPFGLGVDIDLLDETFVVGAEITDTPAITASATYSVSVGIDNDNDESDEDTCTGISWSVNLENTLSCSITGFDDFTLSEWESDPLADGCIGGDDSDDDDGDDGDSGDDGGDDDDDGNSCKVHAVRNKTPTSGARCHVKAKGFSEITGVQLGPYKELRAEKQCAGRCLRHVGCQSFAFNTRNGRCRLYTESVSGLGELLPSMHQFRAFADRDCYQLTTCDSEETSQT